MVGKLLELFFLLPNIVQAIFVTGFDAGIFHASSLTHVGMKHKGLNDVHLDYLRKINSLMTRMNIEK